MVERLSISFFLVNFMNHARAVYRSLRSTNEYVLSITMIIHHLIDLALWNVISVKEKEKPLLKKTFRTPKKVICGICKRPRARLSRNQIRDIFKEIKFTNETSLSNIISLATTSNLPDVLVRRYYLNSFTLALQDRPGSTDTNDLIATNPLGLYLLV